MRALLDARGRKEIPPWILEPTTPTAEKNYSAGEKECLAIWAVQILQPYLQMEEFDLFTDHQALRWIFSLADGSNRLARWRLILMGHRFRVHYKKSAKNTIADTISRLPTYGGVPPCQIWTSRAWPSDKVMVVTKLK